MLYLRLLAGMLLCLATGTVLAQPTPATQPPVPAPMPMSVPILPMPGTGVPMPKAVVVDPNAIAATVNGAPLLELAVQRGLEGVLPAQRAEKRPEVVGFLVDNMLIDQYLVQSKLEAAPKEVDDRLTEMKAELGKRKIDLAEMLKNLKLSEAELRQHIAADLRWERYITSQATEPALKQLFEGNKEMFDETTLRARHVLLTPPSGDVRACEAAVTALRTYKQHIETQAVEALKKAPATADALTRDKIRMQAIEDAFIAIAKDKSACPSKERGGDLSSFQRIGYMVEPFARAAFALKSFEMSDAVKSPYGYHLISAMDRKPGKEVQFEQVKERVRDVYADRLRDHLVAQLRPKAKIEIVPVK